MLSEEDQLKTAFTTPWGTYKYFRMPFGLINIGSTFQRATNFSFQNLIGKIIEIYEDDLTVASKEIYDHFKHLRKVFEKFRQYNISHNPNKSFFGVDQEKFLGHVVSKNEISIDQERIDAIKNISAPKDKRSL